MRPYLLALICVCAAVGALAGSSSSSLAWRRFKSEHGKVYGPEEDAMRFANFLATKQMVERHNENPNATFKMALNRMSDWTREEREQLTVIKLSDTQRRERRGSISPKLAKLLDGPVPKEVDWRKEPNRVTAVKELGGCDCAWAFATTGLLEGQQAMRNISELIPLSAQELVDCSNSNFGCDLGYMDLALKDIALDLGGIESEADYPYEAKAGGCRMDKSKSVMTTKGGHYLEKGNEDALLKAVANYGPVSVGILIFNKFMEYSSGVFYDANCTPDLVGFNHEVLVVGYGTDPTGGDYWIVKNSWGTGWGEEGYIRMKRGVNMCAIANHAVVADF